MPILLVTQAACLVGCGRLGFDPLGTRADASADTGQPRASDANLDAVVPNDIGVDGNDGATSTPWPPIFERPVVITELSVATADDQDPGLTADMLEIFFTSNRSGRDEIWTSSRTDTAEAWSVPTMVDELVGPAVNSNPMPSADGLTLWYAQGRTAIWSATRASRTARWSGTPVVELDSTGFEACPCPSADDLTLAFCAGGSGTDIFSAQRPNTTSPFQPRTPLAALNTPAIEVMPFIRVPGELIALLTSTRSGGQRDIYAATRVDNADMYGPPEPIFAVNTASSDEDPWISDDLRHLVFASDRDGRFNLYEATAR